MRNFICGSGPTSSQVVAIRSSSVATPAWSTLLGTFRVLSTDALSDSASVDWSNKKLSVTSLRAGDCIADRQSVSSRAPHQASPSSFATTSHCHHTSARLVHSADQCVTGEPPVSLAPQTCVTPLEHQSDAPAIPVACVDQDSVSATVCNFDSPHRSNSDQTKLLTWSSVLFAFMSITFPDT